jgi:hypothetical protein
MAPIMNEYKWSFFWRRFLETLFGGLKLFSTAELSFSVRAFQMVLYLVPVVWIVGCVVLQTTGSVSKLSAALIASGKKRFIFFHFHVFFTIFLSHLILS